MKFSILIPYYDPEYRKTKLLKNLLESIVLHSIGQDYEIVIVKDGNSYVESHNTGLKNAKGDYIVVLNDDVVIQDREWLDKLAVDGVIASHALKASHAKPYDELLMPQAECFAMSRTVFERLGLMDDNFKDGFNFEDTDYFLRAKELGIPFHDSHVELAHKGDSTFGEYFSKDRNEMVAKNRAYFDSKWPVK